EVYLNSGTWSLLGVKSPQPIVTMESRRHNWTNEGGVGYIRFIKNIMGMWVVNRLREELCPGKPFPEIVAEAQESRFDEIVDVNAQAFLSPASMKEAFDQALGRHARNEADYFRCAYRSLAICYRNAVRELSQITGKTYHKLYIVGGGAKNAFLNELTRVIAGLEVVALPIEATALGNLKIQMEADK
ncbi:MAG: rhamnulokinase, partial [Lachnospiraceae bacterium]|nr:rhamnulokinase [Lachnospiraceae bacterium]